MYSQSWRTGDRLAKLIEEIAQESGKKWVYVKVKWYALFD
jgi:hypothetical protein